MGFLQRFLKNTYRDAQSPKARSSFQDLTEDQLEAHLNIVRYGDFVLTDAVRPSYDLQIVPGPDIGTTCIRTGKPASGFPC